MNPYEQAGKAYLTRMSDSVSSLEIVVLLYQGMIKNLIGARQAYACGDLETMCTLNQKTVNILMALQTHLDFKNGGEAAVALDRFYTSVFVHLTKVLEATDIEGEFRYIEGNVADVYRFWQKLASRQMAERRPGGDGKPSPMSHDPTMRI